MNPSYYPQYHDYEDMENQRLEEMLDIFMGSWWEDQENQAEEIDGQVNESYEPWSQEEIAEDYETSIPNEGTDK